MILPAVRSVIGFRIRSLWPQNSAQASMNGPGFLLLLKSQSPSPEKKPTISSHVAHFADLVTSFGMFGLLKLIRYSLPD